MLGFNAAQFAALPEGRKTGYHTSAGLMLKGDGKE
jgi:hypothetical protein